MVDMPSAGAADMVVHTFAEGLAARDTDLDAEVGVFAWASLALLPE